MRSQQKKFSLSNDQATALELFRLQEAAQLANDKLLNRPSFTRNNKLSHLVHATLNASQFLVALMDETFHHLHHAINRHLRETDPDIPEMPEERNPIFFVYPICMGISLILCILWIVSKLLNRIPIIALLGNAIGGILIMIGGISAMRHAENHINLNEVSDQELLTHPIFIHNFVICIISIFGMILYLVPAWILLDVYKWQKTRSRLEIDTRHSREVSHNPRSYCRCSHSANSRRCHASSNSFNTSSIKNSTTKQEDEPILYCCCVDWHRYLKASKQADTFTHEFQVIQVM